MGNQYVAQTVEEGVATVTINNPPANALTIAVMTELETTIENLFKDPAIKVGVITGAGQLFVAGADVKEIAGIDSAAKGRELTARGQAAFTKIERGEKPVIAAINGLFCLGGGLELALACHIRIAGDRARLGQPEIDLGIIPGFGGTQRLARVVGRAKATELILSGDRITAQEAKAIGLINKVVPDGEVLKQAQGFARKIASKGQVAVRAALEAIREGLDRPLDEGLALESRLFGKLCETHDMKEGLEAFLNKRQPKFKDR